VPSDSSSSYDPSSKEIAVTRKINFAKVQASLDAVCPKCGKKISPAERRHVDFEHIECPVCGERFVPSRD
jgi:DNA-directed RNA polymerase subunit RPC12/RpoP